MMIENKKERSGLKEHAIVNHFCVPFVDVKHVVNIKLLITACSGNEGIFFRGIRLGITKLVTGLFLSCREEKKRACFCFHFVDTLLKVMQSHIT